MSKKLSVMWLGLRSFPHVQGGVETHAEHICPLLADLGCDVHVITRSNYHDKTLASWRGAKFHRLWSPNSKALEAVLHTLLGVLYAGLVVRPDVLHIQAIGPALMTPLARLMGLKVVVTHHGPDYDRQKWGRAAKYVLRLGERFGSRHSNEHIVISQVIRSLVQNKHAVNSVLIPNGVLLPELVSSSDSLSQFDLTAGKYIVLVSRLVPEKRHLDLIEAFILADLSDWKLVLVGASDHPDTYTRQVLETAEQSANVVCTGFQSGLTLKELYTHAAIFVLPSSHEGLPIAMLEALSYGLPVIASDIPANLEVNLPEEHYFPLGDVIALSAKLRDFSLRVLTMEEREARRVWVVERYDWYDIAQRTLAVYQNVLGKIDNA
jgi:glycosyltransferase involved in cell wall biosynthesis